MVRKNPDFYLSKNKKEIQSDKQEKTEPEQRKVFKKKEPSKDEDEWEQLTLF